VTPPSLRTPGAWGAFANRGVPPRVERMRPLLLVGGLLVPFLWLTPGCSSPSNVGGCSSDAECAPGQYCAPANCSPGKVCVGVCENLPATTSGSSSAGGTTAGAGSTGTTSGGSTTSGSSTGTGGGSSTGAPCVPEGSEPHGDDCCPGLVNVGWACAPCGVPGFGYQNCCPGSSIPALYAACCLPLWSAALTTSWPPDAAASGVAGVAGSALVCCPGGMPIATWIDVTGELFPNVLAPWASLTIPWTTVSNAIECVPPCPEGPPGCPQPDAGEPWECSGTGVCGGTDPEGAPGDCCVPDNYSNGLSGGPPDGGC
jgi:hypothetical protein